MQELITFIIPVRHPANAPDWARLKIRLRQTAWSIAAQTDSSWTAVVVANRSADLPKLPQKFRVELVDFPPNPMYDLHLHDRQTAYEAVRLDKGRRVLAGLLSQPRSRYLMVVDDDDFISRRITAHVKSQSNSVGWEVKRGWLWQEASPFLLAYNEFSKLCGTSLIVNSEIISLPSDMDGANTYIMDMLGSHLKLPVMMTSLGTPLTPLPFRGAIYRVGHLGAHSKSKSLVRGHLVNRSTIRRPASLVKRLSELRLISQSLRQEFFGGRGATAQY